MVKIVSMRLSEEVIHIRERVTRLNDDGGEGEAPIELIELRNEGVGEQKVIVDELAIRATGPIRYAPAEGLERAGQDLTDAMGVLEADFIGVDMVTEAASLDDGDKAPAKLGFFGLGEFDRDDTSRKEAVEHGPEAFAHTGGVNDDVLGMPGFGEDFDLSTDGKVVFADPTVAGDDMVGGALERGEGGEVDLNDGEGGGITAGVAETEVGGMERIEAGFVHAGDIEEESHRLPFGFAPCGRAARVEPHPRPLSQWKYTLGEGRR